MAKQIVNIGNSANDGAGDPLRTAFDKINDNFTELYTELGGTSLSNVSIAGNTISTDNTNGDLTLSPAGSGAVVIDTAKNLRFTTHTDNAVLKFDADGNVVNSGINYDGATLTAGSLTINTTTRTVGTSSGGLTINSLADILVSATTTTTVGGADVVIAPTGETTVHSDLLPDATANNRNLGTAANTWATITTAKLNNTGDRFTMGGQYTPATSVGAAGDLAGDVAFDGTYIYYCKAAHDGVTDIWNRVAWTDTGAW